MSWTQKTVGKRRVAWRVPAEAARAWQEEVASWHPDWALCTKGVHRFRTFEEADAWMTSELARKALERRAQRTSSESPGA